MTGIYPARLPEVKLISALANKIWPQVYDYMISQEQIRYMLELLYTEEALSRQISDGQDFIVYYHDSIPLGFAAFAPEAQAGFYKLHKLYLDPSMQGKSIGLALLNHVMDVAIKAEAHTLRLNVNKHNKTISFYEKHDFKISSEVVIDIGGGYVMDDYVMERELG